MKRMWWLAWVIAAVGGEAAPAVPIEDFARPAAVTHAKLSPDGQYVAYLREYEGKQTLFLSDLRTAKPTRVVPRAERNTFETQDVLSFEWAGDRRLVFTTVIWDHRITGMSAVDCDGQHWKLLTGSDAKIPNEDPLFATAVIHRCDDPGQSVLLLGVRVPVRRRLQAGQQLHPDVVKVNTYTGHYAVVAENPGKIVWWEADPAGCVRVGIAEDGGIIYRDREGAPWRSFPGRAGVKPLGFEGSNQRLYVAALSPRERVGIYHFDLAGGNLGDAILDDGEFDIVSEDFVLARSGIPLAGPVFSRLRPGIMGAYYVTDGPQVRWFDPDYASAQRAIDRALPGTFNLITSRSRDERRLLVLAFSDRDPGTYFLYDRADNSLTLVATLMGWIKPQQMAAMYPIKFPARDGLVVHGYLTFPPGGPRKGLPLVVRPHNEPWMRDVWGFDPLVQMLASCGYAVLQVNYRGTTGYGVEFHAKGGGAAGRAFLDDIEDGARWAIAQGFADPKRIAIVGENYGGYAALSALDHSPGLYRCGVSISGVTDWPAILEKSADAEHAVGREYWIEQLADPKLDQSDMRAISPVNFADRIAAPVLVIQGKEDHIVPPAQASTMLAALEKAGRAPESLFLEGVGHQYRGEAARVAVCQRVAAFLAKHLTP
jgi:dipeptidyl aminopeptidase/acylaminoacyl peptidase